MSITEVSISRTSKEERYYRRKADQYLAAHAETQVQFKWKLTIQVVFFSSLAAYHSGLNGDEGEKIRVQTSRGFSTKDEAFADAQKQAEIDAERREVQRKGDILEFFMHMGTELPPRGQIYQPNQVIPAQRERFLRYRYEIIQQ